MPLIYNSKKLIPAPFCSISKEYQRSGDGLKIGCVFRITLQGTLVAFMGSPDSEKAFWDQIGYPDDEIIEHDSRLGAILRKQEAIRKIFSEDGKALEITPLDGTEPIKFYPRVIDITFNEGIWVDTCLYTITLEADRMYPENEDNFNPNLNDASENWQIETDENQPENEFIPRTYRLTHSISAVGKPTYNEIGELINEPWKEARNWVQSKMGYDPNIAMSSGVNNLPSYYSGWNLVRTEQTDEKQGSYFVTETWLLASGSALENFNVEVNKSLDSSLSRVSIQGDILGLENRDANNNLITHKFTNAELKWNQVSGVLYSRAQNYSGLSNLNIIPVSNRIGRNPTVGSISYTYEFDDRPSNIIPGALSEIITISEGLIGQSYASIFILGRANGPILQNLNTRPAATRTLNIELLMPIANFGSNSTTDIRNAFFTQNPRLNAATSTAFANIWYAADPTQQGYVKVFQEQPTENWNPKTGSYNYTQQWTFEYAQ